MSSVGEVGLDAGEETTFLENGDDIRKWAEESERASRWEWGMSREVRMAESSGH